jgi:membrane glycosyltransferase
LFPSWPEWHPEWAIALFSATATLLFLPKILSALLVIIKGPREYGGPLPVLGSLVVEMLFSALLAPIRMLFHTQFVTAAFLGITIQWKSPPREDAATPWSEAIARHGPGTALGVIWAAYIYWLKPDYLWWLLPIVGSLILAVPMSVWSSRVTLGRAFKKPRLFLIPEESNTPRELRWTRLGVKKAPEPSNFRRAVVDPVSNAIACAYANPRERRPAAEVNARLRLVAAALKDGPNSLSAIQKNTLIHDPVALSNLHFQVWSSANAHPDWKKG